MVGGNVKSPNIPVEYLIKYPYPGNRDDDDDKLKTSALEKLIDDYGPENVMFLAQSVKRADLPIRVHVNQLMKKKEKITGLQKYNFVSIFQTQIYFFLKFSQQHLFAAFYSYASLSKRLQK